MHCVVTDRPALFPNAEGAYITTAYWLTASKSFANPAVACSFALITPMGCRIVAVVPDNPTRKTNFSHVSGSMS